MLSRQLALQGTLLLFQETLLTILYPLLEENRPIKIKDQEKKQL